ncbi:MAG: HAD family hydrolase [Candidatus Omnitrophota bacterium]|nr:HAD family hydrolase [Candidatus Omnitrophota bacterium]
MSVNQKSSAVFLDRDGVINDIIFHEEMGIIETPFTAKQFRLLPHAAKAVRRLNCIGLKAVIASNQPGLAMRHFTEKALNDITRKMVRLLKKEGAALDGIYYCVCHPTKGYGRLRRNCPCRKPKPGLLKQAARDLNIDLRTSYMVGDGINDIQAGKRAGCTTLLVGQVKLDWLRLMEKKGAKPDYIVKDLWEAARKIAAIEKRRLANRVRRPTR